MDLSGCAESMEASTDFSGCAESMEASMDLSGCAHTSLTGFCSQTMHHPERDKQRKIATCGPGILCNLTVRSRPRSRFGHSINRSQQVCTS
jgi:hypothetical protein